MNTPLEQFQIESIFKPYLMLSNMTIYLNLVIILTLSLSLCLSHSQHSDIRFGIIESIIDSISNITATSGLRSEYFLIKLISLLIFILIGNLIGVIPYTFSITTHFSITISFSLAIIASITIISILRNGILFLNTFIPYGTPLPLAPLLLIIETISYTSRSISLGTRLAANLLAGHTLLHIISGFIGAIKLWLQLGEVNTLVLLLLPLVLLLSLFVMELIIAVLQGYVFLLLTYNYLSNALYLH